MPFKSATTLSRDASNAQDAQVCAQFKTGTQVPQAAAHARGVGSEWHVQEAVLVLPEGVALHMRVGAAQLAVVPHQGGFTFEGEEGVLALEEFDKGVRATMPSLPSSEASSASQRGTSTNSNGTGDVWGRSPLRLVAAVGYAESLCQRESLSTTAPAQRGTTTTPNFRCLVHLRIVAGGGSTVYHSSR